MLAIFDLGRTHKKFMLLDRHYQVVTETATTIADSTDEDGQPCEDLRAIAAWIRVQLNDVLQKGIHTIEGINFSAHGASLVHLDAEGQAVAPLYDYMKVLPEEITEAFYEMFGGRTAFSIATGSPALGMLNSSLQLYWLKKQQPERFNRIHTSLHLPQYAHFLFSGKRYADITSIGCHTGMWDFEKKSYHPWLKEAGVSHLLPEATPFSTHDTVVFGERRIPVGIGMHDSSAALLPFVKTAKEPFVLLSTGTWNITLNPFFSGRLTETEYKKDCLYYLLDKDRQVAASRLFLGNEYDHQVKRLSAHFNKQPDYFQTVQPRETDVADALNKRAPEEVFYPQTMKGTGPFPDLNAPETDLSRFDCFEVAYHKMMLDMVYLQKISLELVCGEVQRLYISGGFLKSPVFMELLQAFLPDWQLFIAENKRASVLGAAVAMHALWQEGPLPDSVSPVLPFSRRLALDVSSYRAPDFQSTALNLKKQAS